MADDLKQVIANRLRAVREESGLTQAEVADHLGLARSSYSLIEIGRNSLGLEHLVRLQGLFGKSTAYILGFSTPELEPDEVQLLEYYRSLSNEMAKRYILEFARGAMKMKTNDLE